MFMLIKYMLRNVYVSLHCREGFPILSISYNLLYPKESFTYNFKTARKKRFQLIPISYYLNKRILFQLVSKSLVFSLIAIKRKIFPSIRLFT